MPRKLYDENGDEVEVLSDEEVNELKTKSEKVSELEKQISDLSADEGNRNWKAIREAKANLEAKLKEMGVETDENGKPKPKSSFTEEDISNLVKKQANQLFVDRELATAMKVLTEDQQKVVKSYFSKLTNGEEISPDNVSKFIESSIRAAVPTNDVNPILKNIAGGTSSGTPNNVGDTKFSDTEAGKSLATELGMTLEQTK